MEAIVIPQNNTTEMTEPSQNISDSVKSGFIYLIEKSHFLEKKNFLKIISNMDPRRISNPEVRVVAEYIYDYFKSHSNFPSKRNLCHHFEWSEDLEGDPADYQRIIQYLKSSYIRSSITKTLSYLEKDDLSALKEIVRAIRVVEDSGVSLVEEFDLATSEFNELFVKEERIPTPWEDVNKNMAGGLGRGELGIVMLPSGWGKSWFLVSLGLHAFRTGKRVIYFTLELDQKYVMKRFLKMFAPYCKGRASSYRDVYQIMKELMFSQDNLLKIVFCNAMEDIEHYIALYNPDVVLIDYADLIYDVETDKEKNYLLLQKIYRKLRLIAKVYNTAVWSASQLNRGSLSKQADVDFIEKYIADSFAKVFEIDFGMAFIPDSENSTPDIHVGFGKIFKNRMGAVRKLEYTINFENYTVDVAVK